MREIIMPSSKPLSLENILRRNLDIHSYYGARGLVEGIDAHFLMTAWKQGYTVAVTTLKVSEFWSDEGIFATKDYTEILIKSRRAFRYPYIAFICKMPSLTVDGTKIGFGLECDSMYTIGTTQFTYAREEGVNLLYFYVASQRKMKTGNIDWAKPADAETAYHTYAIKVNKGFAEYFIDGSLVGVALFGVPSLSTTAISGPPYTIIGSIAPVSQYIIVQIEVYPYEKTDILFPIGINGVFVTDGDPCPPRAYDLYLWQSNMKLRNYNISSGSVVSHPVPVFGYRDKTVHFMADQAGTLDIEIFTLGGNWRTYDSISVTANKLLSYKLTGDVTLIRLVFTPSTYPANILESEVVLGGG